jgi:hypothetical protein
VLTATVTATAKRKAPQGTAKYPKVLQDAAKLRNPNRNCNRKAAKLQSTATAKYRNRKASQSQSTASAKHRNC